MASQMTEIPPLVFADLNGQFTLADGIKKFFMCSHCLLTTAYIKYKDTFWCTACMPKETLITERREYLLGKIELSFSVTLANEEYIL